MKHPLKKGKDYERKIAKLLSDEFSCNVRRTPCSGGLDIKGDLRNLSGVLEGWIFECKKQEHLNIWKAIKQAQAECGAGNKNWAVIFSRNNEQDYVCLELADFVNLLKEIQDLKPKEHYRGLSCGHTTLGG